MVMSLEQQRDFYARVLRALPTDLEDNVVKRWMNDPEGLASMLRSSFVSVASLYPADGEIFTLTINRPFTGLEMVRDDGFSNWQEWKFTGQEIAVAQTKRFKLVSIGEQMNWEAIILELVKHGKIPMGQWRKVFKGAYPEPDKNGPIGIADVSWINPRGSANFPYINTDGTERFELTSSIFYGYWRWLVEE